MPFILKYIHLMILSTCGMLLLCTVFISDPALVNGMVMGKVYWFHLMMLSMAGGYLLTGITTGRKLFTFSPADGLVIILAGIVTITYDRGLNPEPEKMIFAGQLVLLWFILRSILTWYPQLRSFFLFVIIGTGLAEAVWGMRQLHGFTASNHSLFNLTGSFYNPGPYSGYIAMTLPLCLWIILRFKNCKKSSWWRPMVYLYYFAWITLLAVIVVLPAGMSRTAWIAAAVSCGWVYWVQCAGWKKTKRVLKGHRTLSMIFFIIVISIITGALAGIYLIKKDSANGRLLMWKVTTQAIAENPWKGTGLGGFPAAYAETQAEYFSSGKASVQEKMVAGCPEYAFNEFLQIGLEQGMFGLMFFGLLIGYSLYQGIRNRQGGAAGGILALIVFALASYPLQLPEFWVVLVFLMDILNTPVRAETNIPPASFQEKKKKSLLKKIVISTVATGAITAGCIGLFLMQENYYDAYKRWNTLKVMYNTKAYEAACDGYMDLLPRLRHKPEFLFEAGQCLAKRGEYARANELMGRAMKLSADPMIHYMAAKNEQALGNYQKAEEMLLHAIDILPERIYPYYLLAKLYTEPAFFQKEKFLKAADAVLEKEPKVESTAIREMRSEIKKRIENYTTIKKTKN